MTYSKYEEIWNKALEAGKAAGRACLPISMVVQEHVDMLNDASSVRQQWFVADGVCGFAWVQVRPGNSAFANWLKKQKLARTDSYYGGVQIWINDYNQSMQRKEAHAEAMAQVLRESGIDAYAGSRID